MKITVLDEARCGEVAKLVEQVGVDWMQNPYAETHEMLVCVKRDYNAWNSVMILIDLFPRDRQRTHDKYWGKGIAFDVRQRSAHPLTACFIEKVLKQADQNQQWRERYFYSPDTAEAYTEEEAAA